MNDPSAAEMAKELRDMATEVDGGLRDFYDHLAALIERQQQEIDLLKSEAEHWVDDHGTTWTRPTAWAYAQVCKLKERQQEEIERLRKLLEEHQASYSQGWYDATGEWPKPPSA